MFTTGILLLSASLAISALEHPFPSAEYRHEIIYSADEELLSGTATHPAVLRPAAAGRHNRVAFQPAGHLLGTPTLHAVNLFTPNTMQQPAETPGQVENYRRALEEDAREAERAQNDIATVFRGGVQGVNDSRRPKSYVSVKFGEGGKGYDYGYRI